MIELTFPDNVKTCVRQAYAAADVIFEYGIGGSTLLAAELGKTLVSVETDRAFMARAQVELQDTPATVKLIHANIGATKQWGVPLDDSQWQRYPDYAFAPWQQGLEPDVILIDGRFRVACMLAALVNVTRPTTVLWDDYGDRAHYHWIERYCTPVRNVERMAIFEIEHMTCLKNDLLDIAKKLYDPR